MNIVLVYNAKSGSSLSLQALEEKFSKHAIHIKKAIKINSHLRRMLKPYLTPNTTIVAVGGDGTINAVAALVTGTKAVLAPLPGGTLNHFTKDLSIPQDIDDAIARLPALKKQKVDIAQVNSLFFINNSSIGLYPSSLQLREEYEPTLSKWPAAAVAVVQALIRYKTYTVTLNNTTITTPFVFVGNNPYALREFGATDRTSLSEHTLSVFIAKTQTRWGLTIIFLRALLGRLHDTDRFDSFKTKEITIQTRRRSAIAVSHDGEISRVNSPLHYKTVPSSLTILA